MANVSKAENLFWKLGYIKFDDPAGFTVFQNGETMIIDADGIPVCVCCRSCNIRNLTEAEYAAFREYLKGAK